MTPEHLDAIQRPEPERRAAVAYAIRDTLPTRNAWDMADAAIEAAGVPALLAYARDLEARLDVYEAEYGTHTSENQGRGCSACAAAIRVKARERAALTATEARA